MVFISRNKNSTKKQHPKDPLYSETAYDDAFRTMEAKCDDILIPFVNQMFNENYDKTAKVERFRNDWIIRNSDGSSKERITDSNFSITFRDITKKYHIECESSPYDDTMLIRFFEYDTQVAKVESVPSPYSRTFNLPNSGLLLLRSKDERDYAEIRICAPNGQSISYNIPFIKMADYSIDDLFEKQLYLLIPFYIFNLEKELPDIEKNNDRIEDFFERYSAIFKRLEKECQNEVLSTFSVRVIMELTQRVSYKLTTKESQIQKKVGDHMGGKVLDLPVIKYFEQGRTEGMAIGEANGQRKFILELLENLGPVTVSVKDRLDKISDETELTRLFRVAAKATNMQEFEKELH